MSRREWTYGRVNAALWRRRERLFYRLSMPLPKNGMAPELLPISDLAAARRAIDRNLEKAFLPFWETQTAPSGASGYRLNHDVTGRWMGRRPQRTVAQARTLWFFALMMEAGGDRERYHRLARPGHSVLSERLWDPRYGGFFWEFDVFLRRPTESDKHLCAQTFALFALAQYALASGDPEAAKRADDTFEVMERRFYDPPAGGYREVFRRDWSVIADDRPSYLGAPATVKLRNTHMHVLEALSAYYRLRGDATVRQRLLELHEIMTTVTIRRDFPTGAEEHDRQWRPLRDNRSALSSYGHDLESIHLVLDAHNALGGGPGTPMALFEGLFDHALAYGDDRAEGGFFAAGRPGATAGDRTKIWWVQAETLLAALEMFRLTGEARYWQSFGRTLEWITRRQTDWTNGDWHADITAYGLIRGVKAGGWKEPYHQGRALIRCRQLLNELAEIVPTAADGQP
jgi:mannobiose 2-epimerase